MRTRSTLLSLLMIVACGGSQTNESKKASTTSENDLDEEMPGSTKLADGSSASSSIDGGVDTSEQPTDPVTFVIKNTGSDDLVFSTDKGWQPIIFAFSGKPPKAKSIILYPKFCTASCDVAAEERCPYCPEPEKVKEVRAAEKREIVAPGASLSVPWDGEVVVYERTKGKRDGKTKRCECYRKEPVPAETYTVRVCGLRVTKSATERSKLQCVDGSMVVPAEDPLVVELEFADPES